MTDKQIFENEIKCITRRNECVCNGGSDCVKCDLLMDSEEIMKCYNRAIKNINLINRQKAEIESLKQIIDEEDNEILELQKRIIFWREDLNYQPEKIKSAAIKEFAERLKNNTFLAKEKNSVEHTIWIYEIDKIVEEMMEVQE